MRRVFIIGLFSLGALWPCGCAPVALAGGVIAMSLADSNMKREQARRRIEQAQQAKIAEQERGRLAATERRRLEAAERQRAADAEGRLRAAQQQRQREEEERVRLAAFEHQRAQENERRAASAAEQQRRLSEMRRQQDESERMRAAADERAHGILIRLETNLVSARWSRAEFAPAREAVATVEKDGASADVLRRLHVALGLCAFLLDEREIARKEWIAARQAGVTDGRIVARPVWTPGAIELFDATQ